MLLRIVAGFEHATSGEVRIEGRDYAKVPPHRRPVNTVFQRTIMFPHLSVFENVAFGLRVARVARREVISRVEECLALVRLEGLGRRRADELSGGQAQRVSLARALVNRPRILLLDEPLSALDLKVRVDMQAELRRIHREIGATFIYVTHDQQEAMSMSDRVIVLNEGGIEQIGTPDDVYHHPRTRFVAEFIGDSNLLPVEVVARSGGVSIARLVSGGHEFRLRHPAASGSGWIMLRPEGLRLRGVAGDGGVRGTVTDTAFLGASIAYRVDVGGVEIRVHELGSPSGLSPAVGDQVAVLYEPESCKLVSGIPDALPAEHPDAAA